MRKKLFTPPLNFAMVAEGVYRSGHPQPVNYPFLERMHLKTIIYLGDRTEEENKDYKQWAEGRGINLITFHANSVKEPFVDNDPVVMTKALEQLMDTRNFPILVHSNKGKHRVGVLVGIMRKMLQGWSLATIFDEYSRFASGKGDADVEFIELYESILHVDVNYVPSWMRMDDT